MNSAVIFMPIFYSADTKTDESEEPEILSNVRVEEETDKEFEILEEEEMEVKKEEELEVKEESLDDVATDRKEVKSESEEEDHEQKEKKPFKEEVTDEKESESDDDEMDTTPAEVTGASVVKYNVKTTPFLQR